MSDLERIERMLRDTPPPVDVPERLEAVAHRAALGVAKADTVGARRALRRPRWRVGRTGRINKRGVRGKSRAPIIG